MPGGIDALGHELADCFWSVLIIADAYGVDLETVFERTMNELSVAIQGMIAEV